MRVLFLGLKIFSATGGIEQVNKNWLYALKNIAKRREINYNAMAMYDGSGEETFIDAKNFKGYSGNKVLFGLAVLYRAFRLNVIVISHLNLSLFALLAKLINPRVKIIVQLHGIEAWAKLSGVKERLLFHADQILAVSKFTQDSIIQRYPSLEHKISVFKNSLAPLKKYEWDETIRNSFRNQLEISSEKKLVITIGRLLRSEAYKGYDKTIEAIAKLGDENIEYHIIGKYETQEMERLKDLISKYKMEHQVKLIGFVSEEILDNYYQAADLFVMPSKGEGFGLVFIDAMAYGLRVIGGNMDGSVDAISDFKESYLVNPDNEDEIAQAIKDALKINWSVSDRVQLSAHCKKMFSANQFEINVERILF